MILEGWSQVWLKRCRGASWRCRGAGLSLRPAQATWRCARPPRWKVRGRPWPTTIETAWQGPIRIRRSLAAQNIRQRNRPRANSPPCLQRLTARTAPNPEGPIRETLIRRAPAASRIPTGLPTTPGQVLTVRSVTTPSAATAPRMSSPRSTLTAPMARSAVTARPARTLCRVRVLRAGRTLVDRARVDRARPRQ